MTTTGKIDSAALLQGLHVWEDAWKQQDASVTMKKILDEHVTLHADKILFDSDVQGIENIVQLHSKYFSRFPKFEHFSVASATNPDTNCAFSLWVDKATPASICGIWKLIFNPDNNLIKDIYFLRQLHEEEAQHKLVDPKSIARGDFDLISKFGVSETKTAAVVQETKSKEACAAARKTAEQFSKIWETGNVDIAKDIMHENVICIDLFHGHETKSRDEWTAMLKEWFEKYQVPKGAGAAGHEIDVGVSDDGRFGIVHWSHPVAGGGGECVYGMNALCFDLVEKGSGAEAPSQQQPSQQQPSQQQPSQQQPSQQQPSQEGGVEKMAHDAIIKVSAGFRQLFPEERKKMVRDDAYVRTPEK